MTAPTKAPAMAADEARQLLERGDRLMKLGDIVSARALYTRALDADQANAALRLGSTFDPLIYQRIGVRGLQPDAGKAMEWYLTAAEAGNENARRAYDALKRATAQQ
jgi:TPR repeat protein